MKRIHASLLALHLALAALLAISLTPVTASAADALESFMRSIQQTYKKGGNVTATFTQTHTDVLRNKTKSETGTFWAHANGKVHWHYDQPAKKDFVFNGQTAYFYEPENAQVTLFDGVKDSQLYNATQFLWGQGDVELSFKVRACTKKCDTLPGERVVELAPKTALPGVERVLIFADAKTMHVRRSVVFEPLGNRIEYKFDKLQFGATIADSHFAFQIPDGVQVLRASLNGEQPTLAGPDGTDKKPAK